ncbi:MAG TPA: hypothetical protein VH369_18430 [Bryobacteraceae bacterium]|jgi:hypothetical protein
MLKIAAKRKTVTITAQITYDPNDIRETVDLAKAADAEQVVVDKLWERYPVESALLVLATQQRLDESDQLNIKFEIQLDGEDKMSSQNYEEE